MMINNDQGVPQNIMDGLASVIECWGIYIAAPNEETRDSEIDRLNAVGIPDYKMPCGFVVSIEMVPKAWEVKKCPCGDPAHTLWEIEQRELAFAYGGNFVANGNQMNQHTEQRAEPTAPNPEYAEVSIDKIMEYFVKGFDLKGRELSIIRPFEYWYDSAKGKVIFRLWVKSEE